MVFGNGEKCLMIAKSKFDRRYIRRDLNTSKVIYRSQVIRHVLGSRAADLFMRIMRVDSGVKHRVLVAPHAQLRR